jgi:hypothetical protein
VIKKSRTFDKIITNTLVILEVHGCMSMARWADSEILIMPIGFKPITKSFVKNSYIKAVMHCAKRRNENAAQRHRTTFLSWYGT